MAARGRWERDSLTTLISSRFPRKPCNPPQQPFDPQFRPFTEKPLTNPYRHAIPPYVCLH